MSSLLDSLNQSVLEKFETLGIELRNHIDNQFVQLTVQLKAKIENDCEEIIDENTLLFTNDAWIVIEVQR